VSQRATRDPLGACPSLIRGLLLAARWAGRAPAEGIDARSAPVAAPLRGAVDGLRAGVDLNESWTAIAALREEAFASLTLHWLAQEPPRRIDDVLDLHWSWLEPELRDWPPHELVWFLLHVPPRASAQELLRAFYPKIQSVLNQPLAEVEPPPALLAVLRRRLYSRFLLRLEDGGEASATASASASVQRAGLGATASARAFLSLDRSMLHLLVQEAGLHTIALAGGEHPASDLAPRMAELVASEPTRLQRLYKKGLAKPVGSSGEGADPEIAAAHAAARAEASEDLTVALDGLGPTREGDLVGLAGLRLLARGLAGESPILCRNLAQRMNAPAATRFLAWREETEAAPGADGKRARRDEARQELARRLGVVLSRGASRTAAGRLDA